MIRLIVNVVIYFASAALGLLVASWVVPGFDLNLPGFLFGTIVFAIAQSILAPFAMKLAHRYARGLLGGIGLVSTFLALLVAVFVPGGITISGVSAWVIGTLVVWLITALGGWLLPIAAAKWILKEKAAGKKA